MPKKTGHHHTNAAGDVNSCAIVTPPTIATKTTTGVKLQAPSTDNLKTEPIVAVDVNSNDQKNNIFQEILDSDLTCAICREVYINPLVLNCSHSFCKFCVYRWLSRQIGCPECRVAVTFQAENLALRNIINKMIQKSSSIYQAGRDRTVSLRLADEEQQVKDGVVPKVGRKSAHSQTPSNGARSFSTLFNERILRSVEEQEESAYAGRRRGLFPHDDSNSGSDEDSDGLPADETMDLRSQSDEEEYLSDDDDGRILEWGNWGAAMGSIFGDDSDMVESEEDEDSAASIIMNEYMDRGDSDVDDDDDDIEDDADGVSFRAGSSPFPSFHDSSSSSSDTSSSNPDSSSSSSNSSSDNEDGIDNSSVYNSDHYLNGSDLDLDTDDSSDGSFFGGFDPRNESDLEDW